MAVTAETLLLASSMAALLTLLAYTYWKKNLKQAIPTVWEPVAQVKELLLYPLKSGHPIELKSAICTKRGLRMPKNGNKLQLSDRSFIVYNEEFVFVTGRQQPKLVFIKISAFDESRITLEAPGMPQIKIPVPKSEKGRKMDHVKMHKGEKINSMDCGDEVAQWLSKYVFGKNKGLRLGYYDETFRRNINPRFKEHQKFYKLLTNEATGLFSDFSSYHLVNQASLNELRGRIPEAQITVRNFRANILIEGSNLKPFEEDDWRWVKIGDVVLYMARYCTRCIFTTINPVTGIKSENNEPLRTMKGYRRLKDISGITADGDLSVMGLNLGMEIGGVISLGDTVYVGRN